MSMSPLNALSNFKLFIVCQCTPSTYVTFAAFIKKHNCTGCPQLAESITALCGRNIMQAIYVILRFLAT